MSQVCMYIHTHTYSMAAVHVAMVMTYSMAAVHVAMVMTYSMAAVHVAMVMTKYLSDNSYTPDQIEDNT